MNYNNMFEFELMKLVEAEITRLTDNVTNGAAIVDYCDYKHQIGKISGLRAVFDLCEDVNKTLSER